MKLQCGLREDYVASLRKGLLMELSLSYKTESPKQPNTVQHKKHSRLGPHQGSYHEESWKVDEASVRSPRATITPCTKLKKIIARAENSWQSDS